MLTSRSSIAKQPAQIRAYIEKLLLNSALTLDDKLADLASAFPDEQELPSRSAMHRYGQKLERRLSAIRASTEAAKMIRDTLDDREDARSEGLMAIIQSEMFETIMQLQDSTDSDEDPDKRMRMLSDAAKGIATLTRSSIGLKKYQEDLRKVFAQEALASIEVVAKEQGLNQLTTDAIKQGILGISL